MGEVIHLVRPGVAQVGTLAGEPQDLDPAMLSDATLARRHAAVVDAERVVSERRRELHQAIDALRAVGGGLDVTQRAELDGLEEHERQVSARRHVLHWQLDELTAELDRRAPGR